MQVRQVEEGDPKDTVSNSGTATASTSAVRAVQIFEPPMEFPYVEDLTVFSQPSSSDSPFKLCVISAVCSACSPACYDMACTDSDALWTICPSLKACCLDECAMQSTQHVRVVIDELSDVESTSTACDVILDSGADTSVLPLRFSHVGESCAAPDTNVC